MSGKQQGTLEDIFADPVRANIEWRDIESLLGSLGAEIIEGGGSRVAVVLNGRTSVFHRPHPRKEAPKRLVRRMRRFLEEAGVTPWPA
jgi:hypothetical protein